MGVGCIVLFAIEWQYFRLFLYLLMTNPMRNIHSLDLFPGVN